MLKAFGNRFRQGLIACLPKWLKSRVKKKALAWLATGRILGIRLPTWVKPLCKKKALAWIAPAETFCTLAWKHLEVNPEGTVKLCCRAGGPITDADGNPMSLDTHSLAEIWTSPYMKEVRRKMAAGEPVADCGSCYVSELKGTGSYRTGSNKRWLEADGLSLDQAINLAQRGEYSTQQQPVFFQLNLGNLCNLKCRMCSSSFSSQIENDTVHSQWAPRISSHESGLARWSGASLTLKPGGARDVVAEGMAIAVTPGGVAAWIGTAGSFAIPLSGGDRVIGLEIKLAPGYSAPGLRLSVNGVLAFSGVPPADGKQRVELREIDLGRGFKLDVECFAPLHPNPSPSGSGAGDAGVPQLAVEEIILHRTSSSAKQVGFNNVLTTRFDTPGDWHTQDAVLFGEILGDLDHLQELYFTGGEPLINKKFHDMVDHLVRHGVAQRITLQINSNITKVSDEILEKLRHFRRLTMTLSVDGAGQTYDYIRYPGHWSTVARNAQRFLALKNATITARPVITMYNALTITELSRFCEDNQISFVYQECGGPEWLMLKAMPPAGLELAAERCFNFAAREAQARNRPRLQYLAEHLLSFRSWHKPDLLPVFNEFTNDLDVSRNQNFSETFPELVRILADSGYQWSTQPRPAKLLQIGLPDRKAS